MAGFYSARHERILMSGSSEGSMIIFAINKTRKKLALICRTDDGMIKNINTEVLLVFRVEKPHFTCFMIVQYKQGK